MAAPFDHPGWLFELKHDGYRAVAYIGDSAYFFFDSQEFSMKVVIIGTGLHLCRNAAQVNRS